MSIVVNVRGFRNLGNTCYMNAMLQALLSSDVMNNTVIEFIKNNPEKIDTVSPLLIEYCKIIIDLSNNETPNIYTPGSFRHMVGKENLLFRDSRQHDSEELLIYFLNEIVDSKKDKDLMKVIENVCFGSYKQHIKCSICKNIKDDKFKYLDIVLPIPTDTNDIDIEDCFNKFSEWETLDEDNKWLCPICKEKVVIDKRMELDIVPELVILTFNRFKGMRKINQPIKLYPKIELEGVKLKLISTVNHSGGLGGGHYTACISRGDRWFLADDSSIREMNPETILNNGSVYIAMYQIDR